MNKSHPVITVGFPAISRHVSLKPFNTFQVPALASAFVRIQTRAQLAHLIQNAYWGSWPKLVMGQGSNVLFATNYSGLVLKNELMGKSVSAQDTDSIYLKVGGGENWHQLVLYCVKHGYGGIENLIGIPGTVGAAPIQNIGAYGVEFAAVCESVEALDLQTGALRVFTAQACQFAYRSSVFKMALKNRYMVLSLTLKLSKKPHFTLTYQELKKVLSPFIDSHALSLPVVSQVVMRLRQSKLPDPQHIPNAGSFFQNPIVERAHWERLQRKCSGMPRHVLACGRVKLSAAWLIERCGWKGRFYESVGVCEHHALILINPHRVHGSALMRLAQAIRQSVFERFAIYLVSEVHILSLETA